MKPTIFHCFVPCQRDFRRRGARARTLIGCLLGMVLSSPVFATEMSPTAAETLLQIDLQNELILGAHLSPEEAACLNDDAAGGWVTPSKHNLEISDRAQQRTQRALESCTSILSGVSERDTQRKTSEALHRGFAAQLQARLALEETKKHARSCLTERQGVPEFKQCMQAAPSLMSSENAWTRWLDLFVRYSAAK